MKKAIFLIGAGIVISSTIAVGFYPQFKNIFFGVDADLDGTTAFPFKLNRSYADEFPLGFLEENNIVKHINKTYANTTDQKQKYIAEPEVVYDEISLQSIMGFDREAFLLSFFQTVTQGLVSDAEKVQKLVEVLQYGTWHSEEAPTIFNGQMLFDPIGLLRERGMQCGQINRILTDTLEAAGYQTRVVQLHGHVTAEVFYNDDWHHLDANALGFNQHAYNKDKQQLMSVKEILAEPYHVDQLVPYARIFFTKKDVLDFEKRKWLFMYYSGYFYRTEYGGDKITPYFYERQASVSERNDSIYFGWNNYQTYEDVNSIPNVENSQIEKRYFPTLPVWKSITVTPKGYNLKWNESEDWDGDFSHYKVFTYDKSRGWNYPAFYGAEKVKSYWTGDNQLSDSEYMSVNFTPQKNWELIKTTDSEVFIEVDKCTDTYLSIQAVDEYGEAIGKESYIMSAEIHLPTQQECS